MPAKLLCDFRDVKRACLCCGKRLKLNNTRDINRKKFCSAKCSGLYAAKNRMIQDPDFIKRFSLSGCTPEASKKKGHKGSNNPRYMPDRTALKDKRMSTSPEVKEWRLAIFTRDEFKCVSCGQIGGKLNARHILSWKKYPDKRFDVNNGITLCYDCHVTLHKDFRLRKVG